MREKKISIYSFGKKKSGQLVLKGLAALLGLPYWIFSTIVSSPMWLTYMLLKSKTRDRAFHNTVGFGIKLALGTILFIIYTALAFCMLEWPYALALVLMAIPSYSFFFDYCEGMRRFISDIRLSGK